jgi:hypothetical protein
VFSGSNGVDLKDDGGMGPTNWGSYPVGADSGTISDAATNNRRRRPGYFAIYPPNRFPLGPNSGGSAQGPRWSQDPWNARQNPAQWGMIHPRYFNRSVTAMTDAHVENFTIDDLRDMTRWSNCAGTANWAYRPGNQMTN